MIFATMYTINNVLAEEVKKQENALNLARQKRNKDAEDYDYMIAHNEEYTEEQIAKAKEKSRFSDDLYQKIYREYNKVNDALIEFRAQDWK